MSSTQVVTFRVSKVLRSWIDYAVKGGFHCRSELLRLVIGKVAADQTAGNRNPLLEDFFKRELAVGDTCVVGVRLPIPVVSQIKECAGKRHKTVDEWCRAVMSGWQSSFYSFYKQKDPGDTAWLSEYAQQYRDFASQK